MNNINIVNKKDHAPTDRDFYIGRGSVFGNPFTSKESLDYGLVDEIITKNNE